MNIRKRFIMMQMARKRKLIKPGWGHSADIKALVASIDPPSYPSQFLDLQTAADMFRIPAHILNQHDLHPNATNARQAELIEGNTWHDTFWGHV